MLPRSVAIVIVLLCLLLTLSSCNTACVSLWERHCQACHDGKTMLNGSIVIGKEQMKTKYKTLAEFSNACGGSASCMNILKHNKKLFIEVGREIGIKEAQR